MPRTEPRAYLRFLVDEWALVESIYERTRVHPLRPHALQELARQCSSPRPVERLLELGILVPLPHSPAYEMGEFVRQIVEHLRREHSLGLAGELRAYLEDLEYQGTAMAEALEVADQKKLGRHAAALEARVREIDSRIGRNDEAVEEIVIRAKVRRRHTPLRQRYAEVLEAWERYVEPVREMVDPHGPFEALFDRLERELQRVEGALTRHGRLVEERERVEVLEVRLMRLRSRLKRHLSRAVDLLLPLVREVRRNSVVARGASLALKRWREGRLDGEALAGLLPVSRREAPTAISSMASVEAYLADLGDYQAERQPFVTRRQRQEPPEFFHGERVFAELCASAPVEDVLLWLLERYGASAGLDDLLSLYFEAGEPGDRVCPRRCGLESYESPGYRIRAARVALEPVEESTP